MDDQLAILRPEGSVAKDVRKPLRVIGIDLGTTNSTVAEVVWSVEEARELFARCLEVDQETTSGLYTHILVPSAVALHEGKIWIGEGAKRLHARAPELGLETTRNLFLESKNDIGSKRTYHKAPQGFRSAVEIGSKVLGFLKEAAEQFDPRPIDRTVVTVPASFQAAQRIDTVKAARLAGLELSGGDLIDEPVAAFLDYLVTHRNQLSGVFTKTNNLVVFDFGGGTCDVAVFRVGKPNTGESLQISPLAVSRYHRLGGGDIDRAILYEALLPEVLKQNNLDSWALSFEDKKNFVEPALLGVAEALKMGLSNEIARLQSFGQYAGADKNRIVKKQPGQHTCKMKDRVLLLQSPSLSAARFEEILQPFLDHGLLYARETEYRLTCSIFAPIQDALERSRLRAPDIDLCLLVGGSTLIPEVAEAVKEFFGNADVLTYPDREAVQVSVARGAAYHALALALFGRGVFQLSAHERISIRTQSGTYELLPQGTPLPYPAAENWAHTLDLSVPESSLFQGVSLLVELLAGEPSEEWPLLTATWKIPAPVNRGDKLRLEYRLDDNQVLHLRLTLAEREDAPPFEAQLENPLSNVVNPHAKRLKIEQAEEDLRRGIVPKESVPDKIVEIARDYAELQMTEKAISYLNQALRIKNRPDTYILNLLGIYHGERSDFENQEKCYRESNRVDGDTAPLFNLALSQYKRRLYKAAQETIDEALAADSDGPTLTLSAQICEALVDIQGRDDKLRKALEQFRPVRLASDWEVGWLVTACNLASEKERLMEAQAEQKRRISQQSSVRPGDGILPEFAGALKKA